MYYFGIFQNLSAAHPKKQAASGIFTVSCFVLDYYYFLRRYLTPSVGDRVQCPRSKSLQCCLPPRNSHSIIFRNSFQRNKNTLGGLRLTVHRSFSPPRPPISFCARSSLALHSSTSFISFSCSEIQCGWVGGWDGRASLATGEKHQHKM